jgi:3-oxoacyl-[acyl-carrier-protein] synthase-3
MYVPERVLTNFDLEKMVDTSDEWIVSHTGIRERRICADSQACSDLAIEAARAAMAEAGVGPRDVDLVIVATVTGDHQFPATANIVQEQLGIKGAIAFDIAAACTGFICAMSTAAQFIATGHCQTALVIGAETLSKFTDWEDRSTCVLFGDGAGAAVMTPCETGRGVLGFRLVSDGAGAELLKIVAGGSRQPFGPQTFEKHEHLIYMNGHEVFRQAVRGMADVAADALQRAGVRPEDLDCVVPHQANVRIIEALMKRLALPMDHAVVNIDRYGNTSAASIPIALCEARRNGRIRDGDTVLLVGFGAGLTLAGAVLRW